MVSDRAMPSSLCVNVHTAGCAPDAAVYVPTASAPTIPDAVASVSHGQLFAACAMAGRQKRQATQANRLHFRSDSLEMATSLAILRASTFCHIGMDVPRDAF